MFSKRLLFVVLGVSTVLLTVGPTWASSPANDAIPDGITLTLTASPLQIIEDGEGFDRPQLEGFYPSGSPGDPALPSKIYNVALPPDVAWSSLKVEVLRAETVEWRGSYEIAPMPPAMTWIDEREIAHWGEHAASIVDGKNIQVYRSDAYFPSSSVALAATSQMRKWRFVRLLLTPLQYNPVSGKLRLVTEVEVRIAFERDTTLDAERLQLELSDTVMDDRAAEMLYNYDRAKGWYQADNSPIGTKAAGDYYVIITTNAIADGLRSFSDTLDDFIAHKQDYGYTVEMITEDQFNDLSDIGTFPCQAPCGRAERIRRWLMKNWPTKGIKYVLLIGNPDPDKDEVPMKRFWPLENPGHSLSDLDLSPPSDYYYADLTSDWDLDGDQYFGEYKDDRGSGGADFANDVYVGRIPVYRSQDPVWQSRLDRILQKIIHYETSGDLTWRKSALLPMSFHGAQWDWAYLAEAMISDYLTPRAYTSYTMYQRPHGTCQSDSSFTSDEDLLNDRVVQHWQSHDYGIVTWGAHGSATGAAIGYNKCWVGNLLHSGQTGSLDDDHPAFVYQCSCNNGWPEQLDNLGYELLKKGAIATVSASRVTNPSGVCWAPSQCCADSGSIGYYFVEALTRDVPVGVALYDAKAAQGDAWADGISWRNLMAFNLYGDPSTSINSGHPWPPAAPTNLVATAVPESHVRLSWTDNSDNETGFTVLWSTDGQMFWPVSNQPHDTATYVRAETCGTTRYYKVVAHNAYGNSESNVASATALELDEYEPDDNYADASPLAVNSQRQDHTFHVEGDEDWIKFSATEGHSCYIEARADYVTENSLALELYDTNGTTLLAEGTPCAIGSTDSCIAGWVAPASGTYYVKARNSFDSGGCTGYDYEFRIGTSAYPADRPATPSDLSATPLAHDQVSLSWTDNSDDEEGFKIERWGIAGGLGLALWKQVATVGAGYTSYVDAGLTCDTTYRYRIRAYNADGDSYPSPAVTVTTGIQDTYEPDDTYADAKLIFSGGLFHTFHTAEDEDWAKFYAAVGNVYTITTSNLGANNDTALYLYDTDGTTLLAWSYGCSDSDADACLRWVTGSGGWYYVRVANLGGEGGCPGYEYKLAVVGAVDAPNWPDAPSNPAATGLSESAILLSWTDNSDDEEGFKIERWGYSSPPYTLPLWKEIFIVGPDSTNYLDTGLTCDTNYRYRLRAYNESGDSGYTQVVSATTASIDGYEPDDTPAEATAMAVNVGQQRHNLHDSGDEDWIVFAATVGEAYTITMPNYGAAANHDTLIDLYDSDATTVLAGNDNCTLETPASCIRGWVAPATGNYYLRVVSVAEAGGCPGYEYDLLVRDRYFSSTLPTAPTNLTATVVSPSQIDLSWAASGVGSRAAANGNVEGFVVERRYGSAWMQVAKVGTGVTHCKDTGLYCGLTYEYRVSAYGASGSSDYTTVSVATSDCPYWLSEIYLPLVLRNS